MGILTFFSSNNKGHEKYSKAKEDSSSLGNILLERGYVTHEVLEEAIRIQKSQSWLGRILVEMGPNKGGITEEQLEDALLEQKIRRKKARAQDVIKSNSKRHGRLIREVKEQLCSLDQKYSEASEE